MIKYLTLIVIGSFIIALYPMASHAQQYELRQRIISLECVESEVDSGGAVNRDLYPEECWRMPGAPVIPEETTPKQPAQLASTAQEDKGYLAPTGAPIYYVLSIGMILAAAVLLYVRKRPNILIFYHKHDNIEVLDHKNKK